MGRVGKVVQFNRTETPEGIPVAEVMVQLAENERPVIAHRYGPPGSDDSPIEGIDYAILERGPGSGQWYVCAFFDPNHTPVSAQGEVFRYSRNSSGEVMARLHLKSDGTAEVTGTRFVAMADLVSSELTRIKTDLTALKTAVSAGLNAVGVGAAASGTVGAAAFDSSAASVPSDPASVASEKLKTS